MLLGEVHEGKTVVQLPLDSETRIKTGKIPAYAWGCILPEMAVTYFHGLEDDDTFWEDLGLSPSGTAAEREETERLKKLYWATIGQLADRGLVEKEEETGKPCTLCLGDTAISFAGGELIRHVVSGARSDDLSIEKTEDWVTYGMPLEGRFNTGTKKEQYVNTACVKCGCLAIYELRNPPQGAAVLRVRGRKDTQSVEGHKDTCNMQHALQRRRRLKRRVARPQPHDGVPDVEMADAPQQQPPYWERPLAYRQPSRSPPPPPPQLPPEVLTCIMQFMPSGADIGRIERVCSAWCEVSHAGKDMVWKRHVQDQKAKLVAAR
ncbi:unnamed protein product [Vitrella brassicaformis CCMP3155]|uniref:F-box domain-containing protein n=1 Tax=Vitrella brassicaformis (strain CCMP3155) TaxID=1169540 RepID=A0A0G4GQZ7_VITBC|nr:unnamed protein product [Vitrella brassicaformis CCMP3155]|eukprot:CEM32732.1 unnamed protein product [Vitrella brassicaformis CCMP3155]